MFKKLVQEHKSYLKCWRTIQTSITFEHSKVACRMVNNFGTLYNHNWHWSKLDTLASDRFLGWLAKFEYEGVI